MNDDFTGKTFTQILNRLAKEKLPKPLARKTLANEIGCSNTIVERYFRGISLGAPSKGFQQLLTTLLKDKEPRYAAIVLAAYLEFTLGKHSKEGGSPELQSAATYLKELVLREQHASSNAKSSEIKDRNLANFPEAFYPLLVVCGDRREDPQKDWSDLFADSMSPLDLTFLVRLGLRPVTLMPDGTEQKTLIFSDRLFASADESQLRKTFSSVNLLVVGSPKVNLLARRVNFSSLFRFTLKRTDEARLLHERLEKEELLRQTNLVQAFAIMCQTTPHTALDENQRRDLGLSRKQVDELLELGSYLLGQATISDALEMFYPTGISDLAKRYHWTRHSDAEKLGFVSLAAHPFNPERVCILAAGLEGVSTAHCLKSLVHAKKAYAEHPFGGVLTVTYKNSRNEPQDALYKIEKPTYTPNNLLKSLDEIINAQSVTETARARDSDEPWTEEEAQAAKGLIQRLITGLV